MLGRGTRARRRAVAGMLLCAAIGGTTAAPASAEIRAGQGSPSVTNGVAAGRDIVGVSVEYDSAGTLTGAVTLRGVPSAATNAYVAVSTGEWSGATCDASALILAPLDPNDRQVGWSPRDPSGAGTAARTIEGTKVTLKASDPALAGAEPDCAFARTMYDTHSFYDSSGAFDLDVTQRDPPPPPPLDPRPQPQPSPQPSPQPQPQPQPAPQPRPQPALQPAPAAKPQKLAPPKGVLLAVEVPAVQPLKRNRWRTAKLRVANTGSKAAKLVRVKLRVPKGVRAKRRTLSLGTIKPGKRKTVKVKVRLTRKAKATSTVVARASSATKGAKTARGRLVLKLWKKGGKVRPKPAPAPGPAPAPELPALAGQAFTRVEVDVMSSNRWYGLTFLDGQWAYRGIPEGAGFPACTAKTAGVDEHGDPTDGCLPYTYDPRTNALTVDGQPLTLSPDRTSITEGESTYTLSPIPAAGSTWNLALKGIAVSGFWPNQFVSQNWLAMNAAGEFTNSRETIGSWGGGAMNPGGGNFASSSPDQRGTYAVLPGGVIEFRYADGKVVRESILITRDAKTGDADPARVGFLLDGVQYFLDTD